LIHANCGYNLTSSMFVIDLTLDSAKNGSSTKNAEAIKTRYERRVASMLRHDHRAHVAGEIFKVVESLIDFVGIQWNRLGDDA